MQPGCLLQFSHCSAEVVLVVTFFSALKLSSPITVVIENLPFSIINLTSIHLTTARASDSVIELCSIDWKCARYKLVKTPSCCWDGRLMAPYQSYRLSLSWPWNDPLKVNRGQRSRCTCLNWAMVNIFVYRRPTPRSNRWDDMRHLDRFRCCLVPGVARWTPCQSA